ncbi:MAG: glycosyl transferase family 1 [Myxococcales bacterium 68-20]|nr:glycosyltransferase family 4 protein [Myxococcales bacterium]OJY25140.1 MAG: glycosyl transferase family 1 [Myxococcales bacterium 68-20]
MSRRRRLLSIAHSYVVALNRRLAHAIAKEGEHWEVTAVAPTFFHGDLRPIRLEHGPAEASSLEGVQAYLSRSPHLFAYGGRLARILAQDWDMVHCWEEPFVLAGAQVAMWTPRRTPVVYTTAQNLPKRYPPPFCWTERLSLERASGWMAMGHTVAETLANRPGYRSKPWRVVPLGLDVNQFRPDLRAGAAARAQLRLRASGAPVVGYLGRFVPEKGLPLLMSALAELETPWRALFVGGGPLEPELRRWAARYDDDRVRIVTGVKHDDVPSHLNAMDILCAPSQTTRSWREQFGRMLIEAFACGVPVIASDSGEIPHVVADAGEIVGERDVDAWRLAIGTLLESPSRRYELAQKGRARAETTYSWSVVGRQTLRFFDELVDDARSEAA